MATPDVRVKLSAEGVAEVVAALNKIREESDKTAGRPSRSFLGLNSVLGGTTKLLAGVGVTLSAVAGAAGFASLVRGGIETADMMGDVAVQTGVAVEQLSALQHAAIQNNKNLGDVTTALDRTNKSVAELRDDSPQATANFAKLGLAARDFQGKNAAESLELIAKRLVAVPDPAQRTQIAMSLLGRQGAALIPTLHDLAEQGLGGLIERSREAGTLLDDEMVRTIKEVNDQLDILKLQARVTGASFASGFLPEIKNALQLVSGELKGNRDAWKEWGKGVGEVVNFLVFIVSAAIDGIVTAVRTVGVIVGSVGAAAKAAARGNVNDAVDIVKGGLAEIRRLSDEEDKRQKARLQLAFGKAAGPELPPGFKGKTGGTEAGAGERDSTTALQRRSETARTLLEKELQFTKLQARLRREADKREFERGLIDVRQFFQRRRQVVTQESNAEIATLLKKRALLAAETDTQKRTTETAQIDTQIASVRLERENELANITLEEKNAIRELASDRLTLEQSVLEAQGRRHEAELAAIEQERQAELRSIEAKKGAPSLSDAVLVTQRAAARKGSADFDEITRQAQGALNALAADRQKIQDEVSAGVLGQFSGEQQILELEKQRLVTIQQLAQAQLAAAEATGDPEKIAQAQALADSVGQVALHISAADNAMAQFGATLENAGLNALTNFFDSGMEGFSNLKQTGLDAIRSIAAAIQQLASQKLAEGIFKFAGTLFSRGGTVEAKAGGGSIGGKKAAWVSTGEYRVPASIAGLPSVRAHLERVNRHGMAALGGRRTSPAGSASGLIRGPGTGTSDSIFGLFDQGDYIVRAASVNQPGVLAHLVELTHGGTKPLMDDVSVVAVPEAAHLAIGGTVGGAGSGSGVAPDAPRDGRLVVGLEPGLVARELESPSGQRVIVHQIAKNKRAVNHVLGGR